MTHAKRRPNRVGWALLLLIGGIAALSVFGNSAPPPDPSAPPRPTQDERAAAYAAGAAEIRNLGWHCPEITSMKHTETRSNGSKVYRVACGVRGPYYLFTTDYIGGHSILLPVN